MNINKLYSKSIYLVLCIIISGSILLSCENNNSSQVPEKTYIGPADKVEVVYFHRPRRCTACLFAEERIIYVLNTHYTNELAEGDITLDIYEVTDENVTEIRKKFGAYGSQLFINRIKNGIDHIRYIEEIWTWECLDNKEIFDTTLINQIDYSLYGDKLNAVYN